MSLAVITGGGTGIGRALALRLSSRGVRVLIVGRRAAPLAETVALAAAAGGAAVTSLEADVAADDAPALLAAAVAATGTPLRYLVHNAGMLGPIAPLANTSTADLSRTLAVNVTAPLALTRVLLPSLAPGARVLHISSGAAHKAIAGWGAYCISKAAFVMAYKMLALELEPRGIAVGSVRPGIVDTDMQTDIRAGDVQSFPDAPRFVALKAAADAAPARAPGSPPPTDALDTTANVAVFLSFILCDVGADEFVKEEWDIREKAHHSRWAVVTSKQGEKPHEDKSLQR